MTDDEDLQAVGALDREVVAKDRPREEQAAWAWSASLWRIDRTGSVKEGSSSRAAPARETRASW
jgi:hypothetical protein